MEPPRILLVEDNVVNQKVATLFLRRMGYQVDVAENGALALEALASRTYHAVLMDCHMPVMDGYEATAEIRRRESSHHVPIIAVTANAEPGNRERCLDCGMDDYLTKPLDSTQLREKLVAWTSAAPDGGQSST